MCEDSYINVFAIKVILRCYELASGLKINFHKSKLVGINVERNSLDFYAKSINCTLNHYIITIPFSPAILPLSEAILLQCSSGLVWVLAEN